MKPELLVTLWPSFPHYRGFSRDSRLAGIRLNSAMMTAPELDAELEKIRMNPGRVPLWYDIKGRQPRIIEVIPNEDHLDLRLNHAVEVRTPCPVILKGGADHALLDHLEEDGRRLVFRGGPRYQVKAGESLYLRDPNLRIKGDILTPDEIAKIEKVRAAGFKRWFLSYVEQQSDLDRFQELVGKDAEIWLKIESMAGLRFVSEQFRKRDNLVLVAARGDLYVEIDKPHRIGQALRLIVDKDPKACVASRIMLSVVDKTADTETLWRYRDADDNEFYLSQPTESGWVRSPLTGEALQMTPEKTYLGANKIVCNPVPSCADFLELEWLWWFGYRRMMLCDEMCLREDLLTTCVNAFDAWRQDLPDPAR